MASSTVANAATAIQVECCWGAAEPANISNSTFRNNFTALGGYAGNAQVISSTTFQDNVFAVTQADKRIFDPTFRNNRYGLYQTERISVYNSTLAVVRPFHPPGLTVQVS